MKFSSIAFQTSYLIAACFLLCSTGCSSLESTFVENPTHDQTFKGMPMVIERPRYMKVTVFEVASQLLIEKSTSSPKTQQPAEDAAAEEGGVGGALGNNNTTITNTSQFIPYGDVINSYEVKIEPITVGEVYTVDLKRPAAGTAKYEMEFAEGKYYPTKLKGEVDDKTLAQVSDFVSSIIDKALGLTPTSGANGKTRQLPTGVEVVELRRSVNRIIIYDLDKMNDANYRPTVVFQ